MYASSNSVLERLKVFLSGLGMLFGVLLRKEENEMAAVYATLIIKGRRTFASIPETLKEQVRQILIDLECEHLIIEE